VTFSLIELFRSFRPGKQRPPRKQPRLSNSDADAVWQECLDRDIYGANTPDYSLHARRAAPRQRSAPERPKPIRQ
jgi:hypothetical protein